MVVVAVKIGVFGFDDSKPRVFGSKLSVRLRVRTESRLLGRMMVFFSVYFEGSSNALYRQRVLGEMISRPYCVYFVLDQPAV